MMGYALSQLDKDNFRWFENDKTRNSLVGIRVNNGNIRGVYPCEIRFTYPISTFVGENGSGKSTFLALAACAFHNNDTFHQFARKKSHFTFGDFFTFSPAETGLHGIEIAYTIRQPDGDVLNIRRKKPSGKWNDYNTRKCRNVVYLGINRIVPPSESSAHRSYHNAFNDEGIAPDVLDKIKTYAGRIFGRNYSTLHVLIHNSYRLYFVERNEVAYSGFNMGAGENAVIAILLELLNAGPGALLVIDEIELGLHAKAQKEFIAVLKEICKEKKAQIICSTHSEVVLRSLPPQARYFIRNQNTQTMITPEISAEFAFGKLAGQNTDELDVFVEDEVAKSVITNILPLRLRERTQVYVIGSDQAVLKQMAARYREAKLNFISFLDGDKRTGLDGQISQIKNHLETTIEDADEFDRAMRQRLHYIPGETWPELSIVQWISDVPDLSDLADRWDISEEEIAVCLEQALGAGKHNEFHKLAGLLSLDDAAVRNDCIKFFKETHPDECDPVVAAIDAVLATL